MGAIALGSAGWMIGVAARLPLVRLVPGRHLHLVLALASGPIEELIRWSEVVGLRLDPLLGVCMGVGWGSIEVGTLVVAIWRARARLRRSRATAATVPLGPVVIERVSALAFHLGAGAAYAVAPQLLPLVAVAHSAVNLSPRAFARRPHLVRTAVVVSGFGMLAVGLALAVVAR